MRHLGKYRKHLKLMFILQALDDTFLSEIEMELISPSHQLIAGSLWVEGVAKMTRRSQGAVVDSTSGSGTDWISTHNI